MSNYYYKSPINAEQMTFGEYCRTFWGEHCPVSASYHPAAAGYCVTTPLFSAFPTWYPKDNFEKLFIKDEEPE